MTYHRRRPKPSRAKMACVENHAGSEKLKKNLILVSLYINPATKTIAVTWNYFKIEILVYLPGYFWCLQMDEWQYL
jgi:hypothetical protein